MLCFSSFLGGLRNFAHIVGVVVSETTSETAIATLKVTANSRNSRPTIPLIISKGMNTATSDVLMDTTVNPISAAPLNVACTTPIPCSRYRVIFSSTTIASSTTNPVEMVRAINDKLSRLYPSRYITPNVPTSESGTAMLGMMVARTVRKNTNTTMITSTIDISRVLSMSLTDALTETVRSMTTESFIDGGIDDCRYGRMACTRSTVSMMLAPGCRKIASMTPSFPLISPRLCVSASESTTSPTSPSRTGAPLL